MTFPHTATIRRLTQSGSKHVYGSAGSIKCFVQPLDAQVAQLYGIVFGKASSCYLPLSSDVSESDQLTIDGVIYSVKGIMPRNYGNLAHKQAILEQL